MQGQRRKEYTTTLLEQGQHNLFFPGGTRSRSGALESKLKLGLLGMAPVAFRRALAAGAPRPRIFVVPCTLTYPLVLEASTLVDEYVRRKGGPQYVDARDEFDRPRRWLDFLRGLRRLDERVHLRISRPLDWLGNTVDDDGTSPDAQGRAVDPSRYLLIDGRLGADPERDAGYTRLLAAALLAAYRRGNTALPSSVAAFAIFERLRRPRTDSNLFQFLDAIDPGLTGKIRLARNVHFVAAGGTDDPARRRGIPMHGVWQGGDTRDGQGLPGHSRAGPLSCVQRRAGRPVR